MRDQRWGSRKIWQTLIAFLLITISACSGNQHEVIGVNPTRAKSAISKFYIPEDLDDCFVELKRMLPSQVLDEMETSEASNMIFFHDNLGRWIRNNWGLWAGSRLSRYFNQMGIEHPDDMSCIILDSFWRHLRGQPIQLEEQVEDFRRYWAMIEMEEPIRPVPPDASTWILKTYNGDTIKLADYLGRAVVLGWWYLLCKRSDAGCEIISELVDLRQRYDSRDLEIIGMAGVHPFDPTKEAKRIQRMISRHMINFTIVLDDHGFEEAMDKFDIFGSSAFPYALVISRDGCITKRVAGFGIEEGPRLLRQAVDDAIKKHNMCE